MYELKSSSVVSTTKNTLGPGATTAIGVRPRAARWCSARGATSGSTERRRAKKAAKPDKGPPRWQRALGKGSARVTFVVGALLTLPGASYIAGLTKIRSLHYSKAGNGAVTVVVQPDHARAARGPAVVLPRSHPDWTPDAITRARAWVGRHWRCASLTRFLAVIGALLVIKGVLQLLS